MKSKTAQRKDQHVELCLTRDVDSAKLETSSWDSVRLPHRALPEIDFAEVRLDTTFLGHSFSSPILISSMTGGTPKTDKINERLLRFAEAKSIPIGLGSQRILLESPDKLKKNRLRKIAPKVKFFANIGAVQLNYGISNDQILRLVDVTEADGLFVHLNPLQEAIQLEGDRNFAGLDRKLRSLRQNLKIPMILKETGSGLDVATAKIAQDIGFDALDVAGMGGTHWGYIEGLRRKERRTLGDLFRGWGIPTPEALQNVRTALGPGFPIIASGGIRSGLDVGRALYRGADFAGIALPFLKAAAQSEKALENFYAFLIEGLRVSLFCTGKLNPKELKAHGALEKT